MELLTVFQEGRQVDEGVLELVELVHEEKLQMAAVVVWQMEDLWLTGLEVEVLTVPNAQVVKQVKAELQKVPNVLNVVEAGRTS